MGDAARNKLPDSGRPDEHDGRCGIDGGGPGDETRRRFVNFLCDLFREWEAETCETSRESE